MIEETENKRNQKKEIRQKKKEEKELISLETRLRRRSPVVMGALILVFIVVAVRLFIVSVVDNDYYEELANNYHFGTMTLEASRGAIYDANGSVLAWSATVYNVYLDPELYREQVHPEEEETDDEAIEEDDTLVSEEVSQSEEELEAEIVTFLCEELDIEEDDVHKAINKDGRYCVLQTQVEKDVATEITDYFSERGFSFIGTEATTRRYYPQEELAASVIGFTNSDGDGQYGLEYEYNEYLSGVDGRVISAQAANGEEMPYRYSTTYDAEDGSSLYLTIDTTIQYYLEKALQEINDQYEVNDRTCGIIMNPKTGGIYAMATYPSFDLNNPSEITDPMTLEQLEETKKEEGEDAYEEAYFDAREKQWRNKTISEINPPGSTFKIVTTASALEESLIDLANDIFVCGGSYTVMGEEIKCSNTSGHGAQTFTQALTNSCNPAFMEIGLRLGVDKFSYYFQSFGLGEKTGIDLPGEVSGSYINEANMTLVDLASSAFGQTNEMTTLELATAYSTAINGGYLITPYVVDHVVDSNGNTVLQNETTIKRQVISEETSAEVREQLLAVVEDNPSHNAYIQGYKIGGKSGTAEIRNTVAIEDDYVSSYVCFAPADDPQILMIIQADYPNPEIGYYGSSVVVPYARDVMEEILPYMGFYPSYTDEEYEDSNVTTPLLQSMDLETAQQTLSDLGLKYTVKGNGETVLSQSPVTGTTIAKGGTVILYTEDTLEDTLVEVPNLVGLSYETAVSSLEYCGLNYVAVGADTSSSGAIVTYQSEEAGTYIDRGSVVTITLTEGVMND